MARLTDARDRDIGKGVMFRTGTSPYRTRRPAVLSSAPSLRVLAVVDLQQRI
jgi:hypothetical protein